MTGRRDPKLNYGTLLDELATRMPDPNRNYYAVTLTKNKDGRFFCSMFSGWVGNSDEGRRVEIREASIVHAEIVIARRREAGERCLVVNEACDLEVFLLAGGHSVIAEKLARSKLSDWLKPETVVEVGLFGFTAVNDLPKGFKNRATSPKLRMQVLKRDSGGCRICGRKPINNPDIELHVHHIRPWKNGGVTAEKNLITLCHTCHAGLSPHYEIALHHMVEPPNAIPSVVTDKVAHEREINHYNSNLFTRELRSK